MPKSRAPYKLPPITLLMLIVEIGIILVCVVLFTRHIMDRSPNLMYGIMNYPANMLQESFTASIFQKTGKIPVWDPFIGFGEGNFENLTSTILNPLLTWPILLMGAVQGGKVALFIHAILLGLGGWTLGRLLRLGPAGRLMLGLLFLGNGSVVVEFGEGFIPYSFPQVYIPWIFTGLVGTLYMRRRWAIALLAVCTALMVFAGGVWYTVPTAIGAAFITAFAVLEWKAETKQIGINRAMIGNLAIAVLLTIGLGAMRLLTYNRGLVYHPPNSASPGVGFFQIARAFFESYTPQPEYGDLWFNYHFVIAGSLALFIVAARLIIYRPADSNRAGIWRIIVPASLIILLLTVWAEGDTWFTQSLYKIITPLQDLKNSGRIGAGVTPWIAVLAAIWFDDIIHFLWQARHRHYIQEKARGFLAPILNLKLKLRLPPFVATTALILALVFAGTMLLTTLNNWNTQVVLATIDQFDRNEAKGLAYLRRVYPTQMLTVLTQGWIVHFGFTNTLARAAAGDATVFTVGVPSTIGPDTTMRTSQEFAVGSNPDFTHWLRQNGYEPVPGAPEAEGDSVAWYLPDAPPYAFWIERSKLDGRDWHPLTRSEIHDVTYFHQVDSIIAVLDDYSPAAVLVLNETSYPGWAVTVNGQPAEVESVGGRLAVVLPDKPAGSGSISVRFDYKPPLITYSAFLTVLSAIACVLFMLRVDKRIPASTICQAQAIAKKAGYLLTRPDLFQSEPDEEDQRPPDDPSPDGAEKHEEEETAQSINKVDKSPSTNGYSTRVKGTSSASSKKGSTRGNDG